MFWLPGATKGWLKNRHENCYGLDMTCISPVQRWGFDVIRSYMLWTYPLMGSQFYGPLGIMGTEEVWPVWRECLHRTWPRELYLVLSPFLSFSLLHGCNNLSSVLHKQASFTMLHVTMDLKTVESDNNGLKSRTLSQSKYFLPFISQVLYLVMENKRTQKIGTRSCVINMTLSEHMPKRHLKLFQD
jgi:hypothetical protein